MRHLDGININIKSISTLSITEKAPLLWSGYSEENRTIKVRQLYWMITHKTLKKRMTQNMFVQYLMSGVVKARPDGSVVSVPDL